MYECKRKSKKSEEGGEGVNDEWSKKEEKRYKEGKVRMRKKKIEIMEEEII
jgi:hypothetical protein